MAGAEFRPVAPAESLAALYPLHQLGRRDEPQHPVTHQPALPSVAEWERSRPDLIWAA
ncbi:hypothetical protein ACFP81_08775 [Deinococcus lacus]|uniref:Uncharacterized protein n=1 Tax=Deinococcus lacus TaxID=392561 RepID=A0ABW1YGV1_9DEIO